jgi:hypothetical protein
MTTTTTSKPMKKRTGLIALALIAIAVVAGVLVYYVAFRPGTGACGNSVNLGTAANFAVLGGSAVTNTGTTTVTGDLGVSPGTSISGFPPGTVSGTQHAANDTASATAQLDAKNAYNAANALTGGTTENGDIGGKTLYCGLYTASSSISAATDVTLDAQGNGNNVFIFQISSTLTTSPGAKVILAGGAQAKNIFWIVGSSATIDTTSVFQGTILSYASVTMNNGAVLNGRALARVGAVTLTGSTVTKP